jgi:LmbE family N-acetylglucosaminyl deacetylase
MSRIHQSGAQSSGSHKVALSFLAHPDDAEILCAGTLVRLAKAGWQVHILTATAGDLGSATEDRWQIAARRTAEAAKAAALIGAQYHCLNEQDTFVCYDKPTLQKTFDVFRRIAPSLVFTHATKDYMIDHEMVSLLARAASFAYSIPNASAHPRHPQSQIPYLYYCDPIEGIDPAGQLVEPTTIIDISAQLETKAQMLACHESQRSWLMEHHGMDEYIDSMRRHAAMRGKPIGVAAAEAFVQHRGHAYPADDLLSKL